MSAYRGATLACSLAAGAACLTFFTLGGRSAGRRVSSKHMPVPQASSCPKSIARTMRDPLFASQTYLASAMKWLQMPDPNMEEAAIAIAGSLNSLKSVEIMVGRLADTHSVVR